MKHQVTKEQLEAQARALLARRATYDLVGDFELTDTMPMTPGLPFARGWIMDELEARDPQAFNTWMETNESSPRRFFTCIDDKGA